MPKCTCESFSTHDPSDKKVPEAKNKAPILTPVKADIAMATYLDVAVLRCLFISQWLEEGIHWALKYLFQRYLNLFYI